MGAGWVVQTLSERRVEAFAGIRVRKGWARALSSCCLPLFLVLGCGEGEEPRACSLEMRFPLTGDVYDAGGNTITPDRVTVAYPQGVAQECEIQGDSRFRCAEGYGTGELTAYYGDETVSKRFEVREAEDGCHALEQEVDLQFE